MKPLDLEAGENLAQLHARLRGRLRADADPEIEGAARLPERDLDAAPTDAALLVGARQAEMSGARWEPAELAVGAGRLLEVRERAPCTPLPGDPGQARPLVEAGPMGGECGDGETGDGLKHVAQRLRRHLPAARIGEGDAVPVEASSVGARSRGHDEQRGQDGGEKEAHHERIRSSQSSRSRVSVVIVNLNGLPWLERGLESVRDYETIVVDHGSTDGSLEMVAGAFPEVRIVEQENIGMGGGNNAGMRVASGEYFLLLNSDAWVVGDAIDRLVSFADEHPEAAIVGPRLHNADGSIQRSVRAFPTLWRLSTEYFFLRKLAPGTNLLNPLYVGSFDHESAREADWLSGACLFVRREATESVGLFDERFFLFSEETDWCYRFHTAGWQVLFTPDAEVVHVGGATHGGRLFRENLRSQLRFFAKHRGPAEAERTRRLLITALDVRGLVLPGDRGRSAREDAAWLRSRSVARVLESGE